MRITLHPKRVKRAREFTESVIPHIQGHEFREQNEERTDEEKFKNMYKGRLAEEGMVVFCKMLFNINVELDYNIYPDVNVGDDQDIVLNGVRLEIKSSAKGSEWLLVDDGIIRRKRNLGVEPHHYIFCIVELDKDENGGEDVCTIVVKGYATRDEVGNALFRYKGEELPKRNTALQANNFCIHMDELHDVKTLIKEII